MWILKNISKCRLCFICDRQCIILFNSLNSHFSYDLVGNNLSFKNTEFSSFAAYVKLLSYNIKSSNIVTSEELILNHIKMYLFYYLFSVLLEM